MYFNLLSEKFFQDTTTYQAEHSVMMLTTLTEKRLKLIPRSPP